MAAAGTTLPVILLNDAALSLPPDLVRPLEPARVIIAGPSRLRMMLAEVAYPEAEVICADFSQSASLAGLKEKVRGSGRLDRLVLAEDGSDSAAMFTLMRTIVTFLPALRRGQGSGVLLVVQAGPAVASLTQFLRRVQPTLDRYGIAVTLWVEGPTSTRPLGAGIDLMDVRSRHTT